MHSQFNFYFLSLFHFQLYLADPVHQMKVAPVILMPSATSLAPLATLANVNLDTTIIKEFAQVS